MPGSEAARIGLILHDFPAGGTERIAIRLANAWAGAGRAVTIFCGTTAGPAYADLADHVRRVPADPAIPRSAMSRWRLGRWLREIVQRHPVDVLVAPGNFHLPILFAAGRLPCAVVAKLSNPLVRRGRSGWLAPALRRRTIRHVDRLIAMSPALAREAEAVIRRPCNVLAEPILTAVASPRARPAGPPVILCAGRMVPQKRFMLALRAFAALTDPAATLILLGDGPERAMLEGEAARLGIAGRTRFVGHVPDIAPWLAQAHALLMTSRYEGYPAVLVEAIAAGVPIVSTPCSLALAEIADPPAAGLIASADPAALAEALRQILSGNGVADDARRTIVARHGAPAAAAAWLALLDRTVTEHAG